MCWYIVIHYQILVLCVVLWSLNRFHLSLSNNIALSLTHTITDTLSVSLLRAILLSVNVCKYACTSFGRHTEQYEYATLAKA